MADDTPNAELAEDVPDTMNPLMPAALEAAASAPSPPTGNEFTSRKTAAHAMMDAALFMANISQLRMLLVEDSATSTRFFIPLLSLIVFSLLCQILFAIIILVIWARETRHCEDPLSRASSTPTHPETDDDVHNLNNHLRHCPSHQNGPVCNNSQPDSTLVQGTEMINVTRETQNDDRLTRRLHVMTLLLVFLITVANMFIMGLGFDTKRERES